MKRGWLMVLLFLIGSLPTATRSAALPPLRRVNVPYLNGPIYLKNTAVFWLGRVTPDDNYADVRVGFNDDDLYFNIAVFDRRAWYDTTPSAADLTAWDSVTLYLDRDGNSGTTLDASAYRIDAQLRWYENYQSYQRAYRGSGGQWQAVTLSALTTNAYLAWEDDVTGGFNNNQNNRGWTAEVRIPFSALGLSGPPPLGTVWGLGVAVHDRDVATAARADQMWPESLSATQSSTWGQLHFGQPSYTGLPAALQGTTTLSGRQMPDAQVGGWSNCGQNVTDYFVNWGGINYADYDFFNVQNQGNLADWPCFAKEYLTFPLTNLPASKVIISAQVTLRHKGNPGGGVWGEAHDSLIHALTVSSDWVTTTLTWNTAPLARENLGSVLVTPLLEANYPGVPYTWDVTRAVAEAYAAGEPLRLAFYSADNDLHSGRYFYSSNNVDPVVRPVLTVKWGAAVTLAEKVYLPLTR